MSGQNSKIVRRWRATALAFGSLASLLVLRAAVGDDHVLTWSTGQQLTLWELPKVRAVYTLKTDFITQPTLSPDRKVVLLQAKNHLALMDALTGAPAGGLPPEAQIHSRNAFRPDGKQLRMRPRTG